MIFPEFSNMSIINGIREKYDPLAHHVRPHITLVFPFESNINANELKRHIENVLSDAKPFQITMQGITPVQSFGNYLFLEIIEGREKIIDLHKCLYTDLLESFFTGWLKYGEYKPHMTVGKLDSVEAYRTAIEDIKDTKDVFCTLIKKVSIEIIDGNEDSLIETEISLV